jgi:hypothetical protein
MTKHRALVYPCSSGIGIEIYNSLKNNKDIELFGLNVGEKSKGFYVYENYYNFISYGDIPNFILLIKKFIFDHDIDTIIPADDNTVMIFKKEESNLGVKVITSPYETSCVARSKLTTYDLLYDIVKTPKIYNLNNIINFPVFVKPDNGAGGVDSYKINNIRQLNDVYTDNHIICEYLPGDEFTIECFTDLDRKLLCSIPRSRSVINNGLSVSTKLLFNRKLISEIYKISEKINSKLVFQGSWFYQLKYDKHNKLTLLEISTRLPGSASLIRNYGINLILLSICLHHGNNVKIPEIKNMNVFNYKIYKNYYNCFSLSLLNNLYVDFDDTLIVNRKVNLDIISLIYKFKNSKKNVYLITRHKYDIFDSLKYYCIHENLFTEIIWINNKKIKKSDYIKDGSIFIDDSFGEREEVLNSNKNIFVFDVDSIEILLNNIHI